MNTHIHKPHKLTTTRAVLCAGGGDGDKELMMRMGEAQHVHARALQALLLSAVETDLHGELLHVAAEHYLTHRATHIFHRASTTKL